MILCNSKSCLLSPNPLSVVLQISIFSSVLLRIPFVSPLSFNFPSFNRSVVDIVTAGNATIPNNVIELTVNRYDGDLNSSVGRVIYKNPVHLWDNTTQKLTDFTTRFSFVIKSLQENNDGDGLAFFLSPNGDIIPPKSAGGHLGLVNSDHRFNSTENPFVAVEFDSYPNTWDPVPKDYHIGIDINSIKSVNSVIWNSSIRDGRTVNALVGYNSSTHELSVFVTYPDNNPVLSRNSSLSYTVDLRSYLPEWVTVGFSAATGYSVELHQILSWEFNSSLEIGNSNKTNSTDPSLEIGNSNKTNSTDPSLEIGNSNETNSTDPSLDIGNSSKTDKIGLIVGLVVGCAALTTGLGLVWFVLWKKKRNRGEEDDKVVFDVAMDDEFEKGTGPRRFLYGELARATNNFVEEHKLGEGGFGGVYKGFLTDLNLDVAVKRVSQGSKQGIKEYMAEVKIISRLRHRNMVQLVGWCHQRCELLLVYEFMPNGSLDSHLFKEKSLLAWQVRYRIAHGLASALLYLHEEWEQCIVHRDIKSSNVMLDSNFNAKLGDFGLARLVDHGQGSQTTVLAGTMGYLAPECVTNGKAGKESDVYSFGIVALEIACGRRPIEPKADPDKVRLVEWVWELYGRGKILEAADARLSMDFDEQQIECLMVVGLWCAHPDHTLRPSIRQVINVLNFEVPLPNLPAKLPMPMYYAPPMHMCKFSYASSSGSTNTERDQSQCSCSSCSTNSSKLTMFSSGSSPSRTLLHSHRIDM